MQSNCICKLFKKFRYGQLIRIIFKSGVQVTYTFIKKKGDCIIVKTFNGRCLVIDCQSIIAIACLPPQLPCTPILQLDNTGTISCEVTITGRILCGSQPISGVTVNLSSDPNILNFTDSSPETNIFGEYQTTATINPSTPTQVIGITAQATYNNMLLTQTNFVLAGCITCTNPVLDVNFPTMVDCVNGSTISGTITCNGSPLEGAIVNFSVSPNNNLVYVSPDQVQTDATGQFTTTIFSTPGVTDTVTVTVTTNVAGQQLTEVSPDITVNCPQVACPCKFKLLTAGASQPGAVIDVTRFGNTETLTGTMNISIEQCGASINQPCNPAINNFNFTFNAGNGETFQFTQGRRTSISCSGNTATLIGVAQGSVNGGPKQTYIVNIEATLDSINNTITWEIEATSDSTILFETAQPFNAASSPQSFIANCP